jgi:tetratricopeptide (TPR) repeat protein/TolB-like protein/predicted Ser/Thr protein kinase
MKGRTLSHYQVHEEISRGGMGIVYRAVDTRLGREVAIKVLPENLGGDADRRERLLQEARAAATLEHPHIAVIHDVGEVDGITYIAMELIRGERLSDLLTRGPLPVTRALSLATEIAEALARAHEKGIIHRDLKPGNVMVTDDGHVKVIDFGLAKLFEASAQDAATASVKQPRTDAGVVLGTAAYMSPEQARGTRIDHRSDIFALGVTLYEMVTGRPAFQGQSSLDTMQAVLTQPVPPLPALAGSTSDVTTEMQRIIAKATAKDPDDRYQGMKDLAVDLRGARRRLDATPISGTVATSPAPAAPSASSRSRLAVGGVMVAALAIAAAVWWLAGRRGAEPAPSGKPALAVLYFENNTGDASLDWMRTGLTDMMVTDLSQSPDFEVMGTDRLVQILRDIQRLDDRTLSAEVVQEIANRARVDTVLVGSYVKAGDVIRISARLQDPRSGRIVTAERVEGTGEASLFGLVDELTRRFKTRLATPRTELLPRPGTTPSGKELDLGIEDVTTSSIEAYRYYAEGMSYHERGLSAQALPLLERAVEIDPKFAMAHAKLAVLHNNMVAYDKRDVHAARALELADRLPTRERYYIEGFYYTNRPETLEKGLDAYRQALRLHPEHQAARHNLGLHLLFLERYPESIEQYEELVRRGTSTPTSYENLAGGLTRSGNVSRALEVADDFVRQHPDNATGHRMRGTALIATGRLDEASAAFQKALALNSFDFAARHGLWIVAVMQERWADASKLADEMARSTNPFQRFLSGMERGFGALARGSSAPALQGFEVSATSPVPQLRAEALGRTVDVLLRMGRVPQGLSHAERAAAVASGTDAEPNALHALAIAQAAAGRFGDARRSIDRLAALAKTAGPAEQRLANWARGELALLEGDKSRAVEELRQALATLPPHGAPIGPPTHHAELWFAAARVFIAAGLDKEAAPQLERLQAAFERGFGIEVWARSFYLLGQIYERAGDHARAREQYRRFVDLWGDGDMERGWVQDARQKIQK